MKADVQYNDFRGQVAADISDYLGQKSGDHLESIGKYFKLDEKRFKIVGLSIYGTENIYISLICVDKTKSTLDKEHIVTMSIDLDKEKQILPILFKRLHIVLHDNFDSKYSKLEYDESVNYEEFHSNDDEENGGDE
jgi:hypothetical protein